MIEFQLKSPPTFFVRLRGENKERELRASINPFATHTIVPYRDMIYLGYPVVYDPRAPQRGDGISVASRTGPVEVPPGRVKEIILGDIVAKNVEVVVYDMPDFLGTEVILGESFLRNFIITLDYKRKVIQIESVDK
jgi:hypothetical protein